VANLSNWRLVQNANLIDSFFGSLTALKFGLAQACQNHSLCKIISNLLFHKEPAYSTGCLYPGQALKRVC